MKKIKHYFLKLMMKTMISCDVATYLISKSRETNLNFKEKMDLKIHLLTCKACRLFGKQIDEMENKIKFSINYFETNQNIHLHQEKKESIKKEIKNS